MKNPIYATGGAAAEYCPLALNLRRGCVHGCLYCYVPLVLRMDRAEFHAQSELRPGVMEALRRQCEKGGGRGRRVLMSFTSDPCQPDPDGLPPTTEQGAICELGQAGYVPVILTKGGTRALPLLPYLKKFGGHLWQTMTAWNPDVSAHWEPRAAAPLDRAACISEARREGVRTEISVEPVFDPVQALLVLRTMAGQVDHIHVGKLNHHPHAKAIERDYGWRRFHDESVEALEKARQPYTIKKSLREYGGGAPRPGRYDTGPEPDPWPGFPEPPEQGGE